MSTTHLAVGEVIDEPVSKASGDAVREAFLADGRCTCGVEFIPPSRALRRHQWRTGEVIEHTYRHAGGCAGGEHVVLDVTYVKEGRA